MYFAARVKYGREKQKSGRGGGDRFQEISEVLEPTNGRGVVRHRHHRDDDRRHHHRSHRLHRRLAAALRVDGLR